MNGFDNLSAMEIDPSSALQEMVDQCTYKCSHIAIRFLTIFAADSNGMMGSMMQDLAFAIPGVDEAMSFAEIMKSVLHSFYPFPGLSRLLLLLSDSSSLDMSSQWNTLSSYSTLRQQVTLSVFSPSPACLRRLWASYPR